MPISFTDNPQVLGNFTPYIQTLPVEDMARVGMVKEEQFQQGVQKVQGYVDSLEGLPIAKDEIKGYVQQKLGQLREGVSKSLAGDFADARVTNQIAGAARTISKDPIIQNGVLSTARMQAAQSQLEEAKKSGKGYGVENEWALQNSISSWLSDGKLDSSFNGSYTPYVDVTGEALKMYKEIHPGENIDEDAFRYDPTKVSKENPLGITANPTMVDGVNPAKIQGVLNLLMQRPDVQQQLSITGQYQYQGQTPNSLGHALASQTNDSLSHIQDTIQGLQIKLATDASVSATSITQQINQLKARAEEIKKSFDGNVSLLKSNPNALKAKLVGEELSTNFIKAYSYEALKKSPLWDAHMEQANYELQEAEFNYKKIHDTDLLNWEKTKENMRLFKKVDADGNPIENPTDVVTTEGNVQEAAAKLGLSTFDQLYQEKVDAFNQGARKMVFSLINNLSDKKNAPINPIKFEPATQSWEFNADKTGEAGYPSITEAKNAYAKLYTEVSAKVKEGGATPTMMREWQKIDPLLRTMNNYRYGYNKLNSSKQTLIDQTVKELKGENPDYVDAYIVKNQTGDWQSAQSRLQNKYGNNWQKDLGVDEWTTTTEAGPQEGHGANFGEYSKFAQRMDDALLPKFKALDEQARGMQLAQIPKVSTIIASKPADKEAIRQLFTNAVGGITSGEGDIQYSNKDFRESLAQKGFENNIYGGYQDPLTKKYYLTVKTDKGPATKLEVSRQQFESIPGFSTTNAFWQKFGDDLSLTNKTTTDVNSTGLSSGYVLDLPPSSKYDVRYHLTMGDTPGKYNIIARIMDKQGNMIVDGVNMELSTSETGVMTTLQQLQNDSAIDILIAVNSKK